MKKNNQNNLSLLTFFDNESPLAIEYRRLYSNIKYLYSDQELRSLLFTSSTLGEGKSTTSSLFAITSAWRHNKKVLLVDADLRRPYLHKLFLLPQTPGLAEVLTGKTKLKESIQTTSLENFSILTSGQTNENPTELLDSPEFIQILSEMKFYFDLVVFDSAPVLPVSDALVIGNQVDGTLLLVKAGSTSRELVKRAKQLLEGAKIKVLGLVMNNMSEVLPYYYNYRHYGYKYSQKNEGKA
jgi:capsular exopolysaccharide synthesis family protein